MGIPVIEEFSTGTLDNGDTITVPKISSTQVGDLMIFILAREGGGLRASAVTPGESWIEVEEALNTYDTAVSAWYRIATTDDQQTGSYAGFTWNASGSGDDAVAWVLRITGHDSTKPIGGIKRLSGGVATSLTCPAAAGDTQATQNSPLFTDWLHIAGAAFDGGDGEFGVTDTSSWTHYNTDRATSNTSLINDNQHLIVSTSGNSVTGAWDYYGSSTRVSDTITWSTATSDGISLVMFVVNGALGAGARTATGSGTGTSSCNGVVVVSRSASGSGIGASSATGVVVVFRSASAFGIGASTSSGLIVSSRTATGSGVGASSAVGSTTPVVSVTASGAGIGTSSVAANVISGRSSVSSGLGGSSSSELHVNVRSASGFGSGTETSVNVIVRLREASGSGSGSSFASANVISIFDVTASGQGIGSSSAAYAILEFQTRTASGQGIGGSLTTSNIFSYIVRNASGEGSGSSSTLSGVLYLREGYGVSFAYGNALWNVTGRPLNEIVMMPPVRFFNARPIRLRRR